MDVVVHYAVHATQVCTDPLIIAAVANRCALKKHQIVRNKGKIMLLHLDGMIMYITA